MRSVTPLGSNPWPHDMVLSIDPDRDQLLELLWVREAWGLHPAGDQPPLLVDVPARSGEPEDRAAWEAAWPEVWEAAVSHTAVPFEPSRFEEQIRNATQPQERAELLRELVGPTWRERFGDAAFDESYRAWSRARLLALKSQRPRSLAEEPERRSLQALIPAWEAGLTKVITIPCRGQYTRIISDSVLLVTETTCSDPDLYAASLGTFAKK